MTLPPPQKRCSRTYNGWGTATVGLGGQHDVGTNCWGMHLRHFLGYAPTSGMHLHRVCTYIRCRCIPDIGTYPTGMHLRRVCTYVGYAPTSGMHLHRVCTYMRIRDIGTYPTRTHLRRVCTYIGYAPTSGMHLHRVCTYVDGYAPTYALRCRQAPYINLDLLMMDS